LNIFFSRVDESDRNIVALTGTLGSILFHNMLASEASGYFTVDSHFIQQVKKNPNQLAFGAQFTTYQGQLAKKVA